MEMLILSKKIGYAVVGLGVGRHHADAAFESENADLIAVCDLIDEKLEKAKEKYGNILTYTDFDEMLKNPDIDIVSICVPSGMHADLAVKALEAGKNVLVEKPVDITVEKALLIEEARKKTGKIAGVVHQNRNNADMAPIKDAISSGKIGKVILGDFSVKWYRTQEYYEADGGWRGTWEFDGGGSLMNQAVHTVDLMIWLMGDVESVTSHAGVFEHDIETEDCTVSLVKFKSGAVANFISTTCAYPGLGTNIQIYGTEGSIEADGAILKAWKFKGQEAEEEEMLKRYAGNETAAALDPKLCTGHKSVVEDIIRAVSTGTDPQILPLEAIKSVKFINAVYESSKTGKTIFFD